MDGGVDLDRSREPGRRVRAVRTNDGARRSGDQRVLGVPIDASERERLPLRWEGSSRLCGCEVSNGQRCRIGDDWKRQEHCPSPR